MKSLDNIHTRKNRKIKIMHITQSAGYGVTVYVKMLLSNTDHERFEQVLLASDYYKKEDYEKIADRLVNVPMEREIDLKKDIQSLRLIRKEIKAYAPDIVYCHSSKAGALGRVAAMGLPVKVIYNPHGWAFSMTCSYPKKFVYACIEKVLAYLTDRIIAVSNFEKSLAMKNHVASADKIRTVYSGICLDGYSPQNIPTRETLKIPSGAYVIGLVGRISVSKAQDTFIKAAVRIKERIPNAYFVIVGGKSDEIPLEELIRECGLESSVLITGEVPNAIGYVELFDLAVMLSRWEAFGLALAEYMLAGKPIIATRAGAIPELIEDGVNGLLVGVDNPEEYTDAVMRLYNDRQLAARLAVNGSEIVRKKFDIKRVAGEHEKIYLDLFSV